MGIVNVSRERAAHWYDRAGTPVYEIPQKGDPSKTRAPNVRDAAKMGLVPGVTTVNNVLAKPGLVAWQIEQGILAALTLPRKDGENDTEFARRVVEDASAASGAAAEKGSEIHAAIQNWLIMPLAPIIPEMRPFIETYACWHYDNMEAVHRSEFSFATDGFGGRVDAYGTGREGRTVLFDIKTQDTKEGKPPAKYDEWGLQLSAYALGVQAGPGTRLLNVVISRNEPGRLEVVEWTDQRVALQEAFLHCLALWRFNNRKYF